MNLENKVELLADEIALMKQEFNQTRTYLREMLGRLGSPSVGDSLRASTPASTTGPEQDAKYSPTGKAVGAPREQLRKSPANGAAVASRRVDMADHNGGGLSLSHDELDIMLEEFKAGARQRAAAGNGAGGMAHLSLDRLTQALRENQVGAGRMAGANGGSGETMTLSLGVLAQMLKGAQAAEVQSGGPPRPKVSDSPRSTTSGVRIANEGGDSGSSVPSITTRLPREAKAGPRRTPTSTTGGMPSVPSPDAYKRVQGATLDVNLMRPI